jgi:hypothetical protein
MRRREESLGFWLQYSPGAHDRRVKVGAVLGSWLKLPILAPAAVDLSAGVSIQANLCTDLSIQEPGVVDGLGFPDKSGCTSSLGMKEPHSGHPNKLEKAEQQENSDASGCTEIMPKRKAEDLGCSNDWQQTAREEETRAGLNLPRERVVPDHFPNIKAVEFSWMNDTEVKSRDMIPAPPVKFRTLLKTGSENKAHSATLLDHLPPASDASGSFLPLNLPIRIGTPRFTRFPHSRTSVDLGSLSIQESERLVHEAETVRGIAHGQGELLALFLSVPVEIVSRVRFVEEAKQLLYTLTSRPDLMRTRVHDMLAVRDRNSGETHLVPHRTRYRMAFLA